MTGETSVSDLLDIAAVAAGFVAQCSFAVPLAECFNKPLLAIWAAKGLTSKTAYLHNVTPKKVIENKKSAAVFDDWPATKLTEATLAFRRF